MTYRPDMTEEELRAFFIEHGKGVDSPREYREKLRQAGYEDVNRVVIVCVSFDGITKITVLALPQGRDFLIVEF